MIVPRTLQTTADVALHYNELDLAYRKIWGEHVHHGYWRTGRETPAEAAKALVRLVEERLELSAGQTVCDIGCGYGATAAMLAKRRGVMVTGLTLSIAQARVAQCAGTPGVSVRVGDWLGNDLSDSAFDRAYSIESSEHMVDKSRFFAQAFRVLRPGGRFVVCAWLAGENPRRWQVRHLLQPICSEGRLPSMGSRAEYQALAAEAGFRLAGYEDIGRNVRRTWSICLRRLIAKIVTDPEVRRLALNPTTRSRAFMLSIPRLIVALRTGVMRYGVFTWEKP